MSRVGLKASGPEIMVGHLSDRARHGPVFAEEKMDALENAYRLHCCVRTR
jgi:hypothetical protein